MHRQDEAHYPQLWEFCYEDMSCYVVSKVDCELAVDIRSILLSASCREVTVSSGACQMLIGVDVEIKNDLVCDCVLDVKSSDHYDDVNLNFKNWLERL